MESGVELKGTRRGTLHRLTDRQCWKLPDGVWPDGGGLELKVSGESRRWYFRYEVKGSTRYVPMGSLADRSLKEARKLAQTYRNQRTEGKDPRAEWEREQAQAAASEQIKQADAERVAATLERYSTNYHAAHLHEWTEKHGREWLASLKNHVFPTLGGKPIGDIKPGEFLALLLPLKAQIGETADRLRQRLEEIYADAILKELCDTNPAAAIRKALKGKGKRVKGHHAAMDWREVPAFIRRLRAFEQISHPTALGLEWLILTAARTNEVIGATWSEVDLRAKTWTMSAERMKAKQPHVVYLTDRCIEILKEAAPYDGERWLFPSAARTAAPMSNMVFLKVLERMGLWGKDVDDSVTVHGFRTSFSTWANEQGHPRDAIEAALSHQESNAVRAAYNRAQYVEQRKRLAQAWADHCSGKAPTKRKGRKPDLSIVAQAA